MYQGSVTGLVVSAHLMNYQLESYQGLDFTGLYWTMKWRGREACHGLGSTHKLLDFVS
jgi:hypothetical protein